VNSKLGIATKQFASSIQSQLICISIFFWNITFSWHILFSKMKCWQLFNFLASGNDLNNS